MENKFKVGDIIKGKKEGHEYYSITTEDMTKAEVISTDCFKEETMRIKILSHKTLSNEVGEEYEVINSTEYFDYYGFDNFTREDLQFADIITLRNSEKYVYADEAIYAEDDDYKADGDVIELCYNYDLTRSSMGFWYSGDPKNYDIVKVERSGEVVYQREDNKETVEMTVAEISEKLGYEVKIVKEN